MIIVTKSGLSGLTKAYVSVLSATGSFEIDGRLAVGRHD